MAATIIPYEALYQALRTMIQTTEDISKSVHEDECPQDGVAFIQQYRTVRFGVSRGAGHTTIARRLAEENFPERTLVVVSDLDRASTLRQSKRSLDGSIRVVTSAYDFQNLKGMLFSLVIVDGSWFMSRNRLDELMRVMVPVCPLFVLLE